MNPPSTRVSIIGAGKVGSTLAQRIAEKNLADVVLLDIVEGWPQGVALDLMQARGVERHDRQIVGTNDYIDTANSNIIVIAAGIPRKPGINREDLIKINAQIVTEAAKQAIAHSPEAILIVVTNPLDIMTYLAWEASGLPKHRVIGMGGILDSARFQTFIAMELGVSIAQVCATVIGSHGDLMVPLPRYSTVNGIPIAQLMDAGAIDRIVQRTRHGGAEIVGLMKNSSAYFAPASSACLMVESILLNQSRLLPCSVYLNGQYGVQDIFLGAPCRLGYQGIEQILELELSDAERAAFQDSGKLVLQSIEEAETILKNAG
ncbi:MAG: malate dehydrogenase [Microcoleus sp. PH2017_29_MFU_D_A]|jgi:malate dehydrogenase|uniref:malate dehydrogenase n=1 Tax=unclassified Microcoleus TaxID=2642155 RepID=UPI001D1BB5A8|nr:MULTISPECIES: malate dehydrogenase [unclassified Microcoleus]MCC3417725.1 malate dehydrogenase [Microcoleus sp. PH2017_07_MST_O_A]MCC3429753.1 malate dehydrogenase [Microcoleus sp. PH2017_04_SCI_O_A]MCC3442008.1 malate dehydrogenase [Microcoleus sp. PH2017_03_ELD_O_A]MCC3467143.1 malate dehydrogenase [Microcoleus sp. PH2017_06_SFM_O_A]MCC3504359.1 malate dehydrogenase [Microcoleus sp. PH2017_19_SFW_U_A]MCC3508280.1 malate dehydrogenase [Microcoleus sp. PH2017_17_BER_D_A]TAE14038.1 MAG: ma